MTPKPDPELSRLLACWQEAPRPRPGTAARVLDDQSAPDGAEARLRLRRVVLAGLAFGSLTGAALGEWYSISHSDALRERMTVRYLESIDPHLHEGGR
jgi:hypothetical protein